MDGQQRKQLREAFIDAFHDKSSLEQMLSDQLDKNLDAIAGGGSLETVVFNLMKVADAQGWLEDLVLKAYEYNSGNQRLKAIAKRCGEAPTATELLKNPAAGATPVLSPLPPTQPTLLQKILILAAIPQGLRLDKEIREIEEAIRRATNRDLFEIKVRTAVRPQDIRRAIAEEQPQIVHFCGHGEKDGSLVLEDDGGNDKPVSPFGLASLFELHSDYLKCVLLNACYSEQSAEAIKQYIDYVIGMNNPIQDKAAIAFSQGFYDGLGYKSSVNQDVFQRAFNEGMVAIKLENISQGAIPVLKKR